MYLRFNTTPLVAVIICSLKRKAILPGTRRFFSFLLHIPRDSLLDSVTGVTWVDSIILVKQPAGLEYLDTFS